MQQREQRADLRSVSNEVSKRSPIKPRPYILGFLIACNQAPVEVIIKAYRVEDETTPVPRDQAAASTS